MKFRQDGEFVIGGYVGDEKRLASLLVGAYQDGALHYVGEVELGFPPGTRPILCREMQALVVGTSLFVNCSPKRDAIWLTPRLVAEVTYQEWLEGFLRHAAFRGISAKKQPHECVLRPRA